MIAFALLFLFFATFTFCLNRHTSTGAVSHLSVQYAAKYLEPLNTGHFYMHMPTSFPYNPKDLMRMRTSPPLNASLDRIRYHTTFVEDKGRPSYFPPPG